MAAYVVISQAGDARRCPAAGVAVKVRQIQKQMGKSTKEPKTIRGFRVGFFENRAQSGQDQKVLLDVLFGESCKTNVFL